MPKLATTLKAYGILAVSYLFLLLILPANKIAKQQYNLSEVGYHVLLFIVVLPLFLIWFGAFYSYARLRQYSESITNSPEGQDFSKLAKGFTWLAWGAVLTSIVSLILNSIANDHPGFHGTALIIANYLTLAVPLIGYHFLAFGARGLTTRAKVVSNGLSAKIWVGFFALIAVVYFWLTVQHVNLDSFTSTDNAYYLPAWLLIVSVVIPYLYTWFIGFRAAHDMYLYSKYVDGLLYKKAMRSLAFGFVAVIDSSIAVQYLRSAVPRTGRLSLNVVLLLINIIYIFMATGYIFISIGARRLRKIEEI